MLINEIKNHQGKLLATLFGVALLPRILTISSPLARDEAITFNNYARLDFLEILNNYPDSNQHALFSILSNISMMIFGEYEIVFRLPSLVAGVLSVPLSYYAFRAIKISEIQAFISSLLLALYVPLITYSQEGRGYALTVFLAICLILSSVKILQSNNIWRWGSLLIGSATCMVITLPSNAVFLAGAAGFCWTFRYFRGLENSVEKQNNSYAFLICYILAFFLVSAYLLINLEDLKISAKANLTLSAGWESLLDISGFLVTPWGFGLYAFFIIGLLSINEKSIKYGFTALFLIPISLTLITGIVGFARVYIYFSPFIFMFASIGFCSVLGLIYDFNKSGMYLALSLSLFWLFYAPIQVLANYYPDRFKVGNGYMQDAIELRDYVSNLPLNNLPIIMNAATGRSILIHYLGENIGSRTKLFVAGKKIEKIIFLSKVGIPPHKFRMHQVFDDAEVAIPENTIKLIKTFGSFQIYEWDVELSRLALGAVDLDYESKLAGLDNLTKTFAIDSPRALGQTSLLIEKPSSTTTYIVFPNIYNVDLYGKEGFIINLFLKAPLHKTSFRTMMESENASRFPSAYINPYLSLSDSTYMSKVSDEKWDWEIVALLSSIGKDSLRIRELIETAERKTMVDGLQSYIIRSNN
jgi:hypothetical protein